MTDLVATISDERLAELARKIIAAPHPEKMPGAHLNAAARAQLAFAHIDQFKREAGAALSALEASPAPVSDEMVLVPRAELAKLVSEYEIEFDPEIINRPTWVKEALEAPAALAAKGGQ